MKIGDRVYVHGYVDEIRKDTIIVRNEGGYFGTVKEEVFAVVNIPQVDKDPAETSDNPYQE
jgi:hypothetical protein